MLDARALALEVLTRGEVKRIPTDPLLAPRLARTRLDERDRRLVTTLIKTTHRWRGRADHVLDGRLKRGIRSLDVNTLNILRLGYVQLFHLSQIPAHAIIHSAVDLTMHTAGPGKARLVNSILRGLVSRPPSPQDWKGENRLRALAGELSHPVWLLERWVPRWGEETVRRICEWNNTSPRMHARLTGTPADRAFALERLEAEQIQYESGQVAEQTIRIASRFPVHDHVLMSKGRLVPQDESQTLVGLLMELPDHGTVLDVCAAPGTKTSHVAERHPGWHVVATDVTTHKVHRLVDTRQRLGLANIELVVADGRRPPFEAVFDAVVLDAPCSGLGVLQRRPDARWLRSPGELLDAALRQRALLGAAAGLLMPGGQLLYSVCSVEPEETSANVAWFREAFPAFEPVPLPDWVPGDIRGDDCQMRILPGTMGMEGAFAAVLRRGR